MYHVTQHPARRTRATANRATRVMYARADDAASRTANSLDGASGAARPMCHRPAQLVQRARGTGGGPPWYRAVSAPCSRSCGAGPALCLFKLEAIAALAVVWRLRTSPLAIPALALSAVLYTAFSVLPWATALAGLQYM